MTGHSVFPLFHVSDRFFQDNESAISQLFRYAHKKMQALRVATAFAWAKIPIGKREREEFEFKAMRSMAESLNRILFATKLSEELPSKLEEVTWYVMPHKER